MVHGTCAAGFEPVRAAFAALQERKGEIGSAVCIHRDGRSVVNLWAGYTSRRKRTCWQQDTVVSIFSVTKALTALCLLHLVDRGLASLDDPIAKHWPEFVRGDPDAKSKVSLHDALRHKAGLPALRNNRPGDVYSWDRMIRALEDAPLVWPANTHVAYHAVTFGHIVGEIIRRVSNQMPSDYFRAHFAVPLDLDLGIRLSTCQKVRLASCDGNRWRDWLTRGKLTFFPAKRGGWQANYFRPCGADYHPNGQRWQQAEAPALTGFGTAESLSRLFAMLACGGALGKRRILSQELIDLVTNENPKPEFDHGTAQYVRMGLGLYFNLSPMTPLGPNADSFGHVGMGGVTSFADPNTSVGFAYTCNHLFQPKPGNPSIIGDRAERLAEALYACL